MAIKSSSNDLADVESGGVVDKPVSGSGDGAQAVARSKRDPKVRRSIVPSIVVGGF
jgi:hypothetical protein